MELSDEQLDQARAALLSDGSDALIEVVFALSLGRTDAALDEAALSKARGLHWVHPDRRAFTKLGELVADPIREYRFWSDRGGQLHSAHAHRLLSLDHYRGKSVLEPGSGFGCNLMSLSRVEGRFVGVEPVTLYRQLTPIFAEREGLPVPEVLAGTAENLPVVDATFDIVLCYSAHQYMKVKEALGEMARVLKPGGQLQIIGGTLGSYAANSGKQLVRNVGLSSLKSYVLTIANTLCYQTIGRRAIVPRGAAATTAPVYPDVRSMLRWIREAGLMPRDDQTRSVGEEMCFIADKPIAS